MSRSWQGEWLLSPLLHHKMAADLGRGTGVRSELNCELRQKLVLKCHASCLDLIPFPCIPILLRM